MMDWWKTRKKRTKIGLIMLVVIVVLFILSLPAKLFTSPTSFVIEDENGELLGATIASDGQWRFPEMEEVPEKFATCIISFEDKRFKWHPGVDLLSIGRAVQQNMRADKTVSGGSTLTMQVVRLSRNNPRTVYQKLLESILALRLECSYSKNEILALYASHAPFGSNVVGLEAAAWRYYGRGPDLLSWGEMAALAVLPNAPALVHPGKNRERLLGKRNRLLDKLLKESKIDSTTNALAKLEPLPDEPKPLPQIAPHLLQRYKQENPAVSNTRITTTLNRNFQQTVARITEQHNRFLRANSINNLCALVVEVETGKTLAYIGNAYHPQNPDLESHVDIIKSVRSPGSTLKPLLYAAMLHQGLILPNTLLPDVPTQIGGYTPQNFERGYDGAVRASSALSRSLNIPAVRMLRDYSYPRFYDFLEQIGITSLTQPAGHYGLSMILGGVEVSPWELAGTYAGMARAVLHASANKGKVLQKDFYPPYYNLDNPSQNKSIAEVPGLDPVSIWHMLQAMEEVMRPGEESLWKNFNAAQKIAWKTGTSFGFRDAWAVGVTPKFAIAVWVGNGHGEGRPDLTGIQTAAPIMFDIVRALPASGWFNIPEAYAQKIAVCAQSGFQPTADCEKIDTVMGSVLSSQMQLCPYHQTIHLDPTEQYRVSESCVEPSAMVHKKWFTLPPAMEWYYKRKHMDYQSLPPYFTGCSNSSRRSAMELIYPIANARIIVPVDLDGTKSEVVFTAAHEKADMKVYWHLDDEYITTTTQYHQVSLNPLPGMHTITLVDQNGESIVSRFEIIK